MIPALNPLTDEHCDCLNQLMERIPQLIELAQTCKECGLPTDQFLEQLQTQLQTAQKLKSKFFPNRP